MPPESSVRPHGDQMSVETHRLVECEPCGGSGYVPAPLLHQPQTIPTITDYGMDVQEQARRLRKEIERMLTPVDTEALQMIYAIK